MRLTIAFRQAILVFCSVFIALSLPNAPAALADEKLIGDANLEQAIRLELKKMSGDLTQEDLLALKSLYPKDKTKPIASLDGLERAVNLTALYLPGFGISDIRPIAKLG